MIPRADRRLLDETVRAAVHGAWAELLRPLLEQPDFQKRLAMAIAAPRPAPSEPPENQATYTTTKAVRDWLERHLVLGGMGKLAASDKVAAMTHHEALQEANQRRLRLRMPPFIFIGTKVEL